MGRVVEAENLWKSFDGITHVLQDVSFHVDEHEVVVLLGRSGSGKTTLLNLLAGLETPDRGVALLNGRDLSSLPPEQRTQSRLHDVGIVFQRFHLIPELTVKENVRLPLDLAKKPRRDDRVDYLLGFFGLSAKAEAFPATLSGGELQRTAIARALANQPKVLLVDEPTANLDTANATLALDSLRRVAKELGTSVLIASHDALALRYASRTLYLEDGRLGPGPTPTGDEAGGRSRRPRPASPPPARRGSR